MRIVVGITGGIAAYKAVTLIRQLTEAGHEVKVIPTANALRFVGAATLEAISHNTVDPDLYTDVADVKHIALAQEADLIIVAPATGSFLARTAAGIADDLLSNVVLASSAPVVLAPAMHTEMWTNAATVQNVTTLRSRGILVIDPASGRLTGSDTGVGRLPEPEEIARIALGALLPRDLEGKMFVVTAGGTQEPLDPVRFIGNRSSGKQGLAIARAASARGAKVTLIAANLEVVEAFDTIHVSTAKELQSALNVVDAKTDCLVMVAAVGDFRLAAPHDQKIKKASDDVDLTLVLERTPDLLSETSTRLRADGADCIVVGFAAETSTSQTELEELAKEKLNRKGCDFLVANDVSNGKVFGLDETSVLLLSKNGTVEEISGDKSRIANRLLDSVSKALNQS
jgi:phosphopantothenoylcysteine decarboxylase/phosphopantothenate--cysteine ligase